MQRLPSTGNLIERSKILTDKNNRSKAQGSLNTEYSNENFSNFMSAHIGKL